MRERVLWREGLVLVHRVGRSRGAVRATRGLKHIGDVLPSLRSLPELSMCRPFLTPVPPGVTGMAFLGNRCCRTPAASVAPKTVTATRYKGGASSLKPQPLAPHVASTASPTRADSPALPSHPARACALCTVLLSKPASVSPAPEAVRGPASHPFPSNAGHYV